MQDNKWLVPRTVAPLALTLTSAPAKLSLRDELVSTEPWRLVGCLRGAADRVVPEAGAWCLPGTWAPPL